MAPWYWLVPARVDTLITPPPKRPQSAERLLLCTLNSWVASTAGMVVTWLVNPLVLGMPSIRISLLCTRPPLIDMLVGARSVKNRRRELREPEWLPAVQRHVHDLAVVHDLP